MKKVNKKRFLIGLFAIVMGYLALGTDLKWMFYPMVIGGLILIVDVVARKLIV